MQRHRLINFTARQKPAYQVQFFCYYWYKKQSFYMF